MKKIVVLCWILSFVLCGCEPYVEEPKAEYKYEVYEVHFSAVLIENESLGNDWSIAYRYRDTPIQNGHRWTVPIGNKETVNIGITVTEKDKHSDIGSGALSVKLADGFETATEIVVTR